MPYVFIGIFSFWFARLSKIPTYISKFLYWLGIKKLVKVETKKAYTLHTIPLITCEKCLAFWLAFFYSMYSIQDFPHTIIYSGCTSALAIILSLLTNKFLR